MSRERRWITAFDEAVRVAAKYGREEAALVLMDAADTEQQLLAASIRRLREGDPRVWRSGHPNPGPIGEAPAADNSAGAESAYTEHQPGSALADQSTSLTDGKGRCIYCCRADFHATDCPALPALPVERAAGTEK